MSNQIEIITPASSQVSIEVQQGAEPSITLEAPSLIPAIELQAEAFQRPTASIRVDTSTSNVIYVGRTSYGVSESSAFWTITRSTFSSTGIRLSRGTASSVNWTNRASHTYT